MSITSDNWDDLRIFLAVARKTSIRQAAIKLNVSHSTVLRRINGFENHLGMRLFERQPDGYYMTTAGEELLSSAIQIEEEILAASRRVAGHDQHLNSMITVTLPDIFSSHLLMPDFAAYQKANPDILLEIVPGYTMANLARREADVAIRVSNNPPDDLVGRRVLDMARATYGRRDLVEKYGKKCAETIGWISWNSGQAPHQRAGRSGHHAPVSQQWKDESDFPDAPISICIPDPASALAAAKQGMGIVLLPCFIGDPDPDLCRVPPGSLHRSTNIWVLTHEDLRNTARIKNFTGFICDAIHKRHDLIEGTSD